MTSETKIQLRLVRCPRCREVLPELPEIRVYQCARCGTVLQAKNRKTEARGTESGLVIDEHGKVETDHIPEQKKISSLNQAASPSKGGPSAEASTSRSSDEFQDRNIKQPGDRSYSDELPISSELLSHENGDFFQEFGEQDKHISSLDQDTGEGKHELGDGSSGCHRARSFSDDLHSSMELTCNETEDSSPEFHSHLSRNKDVHTFDPCIRMDTEDNGNYKAEQDKGYNFRDRVSKTEDKHRENDVSPKFGVDGEEGKIVNLSLQNCTSIEHKVAENADCCRESSSFHVRDYGEHERPTAVIEANQEIGKSIKDHRAESLKVEDNLGKNKIDSINAAETDLDEDIPVQKSISLDNQHQEKNIIPRDFDCGSSVDSFDKLQLDSPSSVFGMKQTDFSKPSMAGNYYSYDGSVSSFDGYEDQIPGQVPKPPRRRFKHSEVTNSNGLHRHEESRSKDFQTNKSDSRHQAIRGSRTHGKLSSESEIRQAARKSLILDENSHYGMKHRQRKLDDLPESISYGHPGVGRSRGDKEDHAAGLSFIPRYSSGQTNGAPLNYQHHVFQPYTGSFSPEVPSYAEPDKEQLLRMVHELKEELNRTQISKTRYLTGDEIHAPLSYNRLAPAEEISADLHFHRYLGRCSPGTGLPPLHKVSRMSYSGDGADYRNQVDCSCLHGCPHDWHYSGQVPSQMMCHNRAHCTSHSGHIRYKGFYSASSSPQHYKSSRLSLYGRETKSDEQNFRDTEMKRHVRERVYSLKRHLMPVAGGIPIVACYHCSELLQLPADFLLFGRRYHRLKCNACEKVMKFSLESGTHLTPKIHSSTAPPPSMVDDCDDSIDQRHWAEASRPSKHPHAEPLSCSDDYGMSFDRSCSTEEEPSLMMPSSGPPKISKTSSGNGGPFQRLEDRKMKSILGESRGTFKNSRENFRSEGPSMKISKRGKSSSEIEELPSTSGSPLHRLMGYLSPSEVIEP